MVIKNKDKRILCILDSHYGELYNIIPMFYHWGSNNELDGCHIDFIYIGHHLTDKQLNTELTILRKYINFKLYIYKIVSPEFSNLKKLINFFRLAIRIFLSKTHYLTLIPYDQKYIFYALMSLKKTKLLAIPHTTGHEIYSEGIFTNRKLRESKAFPVLVKSSESEEYFNAFGYHKLIAGGNYSNSPEYIKSKTIHLGLDPHSRLCVFSLGRESKMFCQDEWIRTHLQVIEAAYSSGYKAICFKMHPSQPLADFELIRKRVNNLQIELELIEGHPIDAVIMFDTFITILTSAGQHAIDFGKPVCCYATAEMRKQVQEFGNDPYPYKPFLIPEITEKKQLSDWLLEVKSKKVEYHPKDINLLSLKEIFKKI